MFSGIVEATGVITFIETIYDCLHVRILPQINFSDLQIGDSVAVNGVCLTVTTLIDNEFTATIVPETLRLTNLKKLSLNEKVNLERSAKLDTRIGGHNVQGHVDGEGEIIDLQSDGESALIAKIQVPDTINKYIVKKGYVTIDGMSITVMDVAPEWFTATFIPHTQEVTVTNQYRKGTCVNIEVDILGKYIEKLLGAQKQCDHI